MCVVNKVLFFAVIIIAFTYSLIKDCPNKQTLWLDHKHSFDDFSCDVPKPLTIPTVELFSESAAKILKLDPWFTVLHRCGRHSGCCQVSTKACLSVEGTEEYVNITFLNITKGLVQEEEEGAFVSILVQNHTKCNCQFVS